MVDFKGRINWFNEIPEFHQGSFVFQAVKHDAWNAYYPYQLLLLHDEGKGDYTITPWRFTLPIAPQELQVSMPVADKIEATLGGYNETFGGAPFRNISFSGTTGVVPECPDGGNRSTVNGGAGGMISRFVSSSISPITKSATTIATGSPPRITNEDKGAPWLTGFWMFHQLRHFLEGYIAIKGRADKLSQGDTDDNGNKILGRAVHPGQIRLAFGMYRDNSMYLCRLVNFEMRRSADSPLEYKYNLQLQAYKRIEISQLGKPFEAFKSPIPKKNIISRALNTIKAVRKITAQINNLINTGLTGPLATIAELSRTFSGTLKDTAGIARSLVDLPATLVHSVLNTAIEIKRQMDAGAFDVRGTFSGTDALYKAIDAKMAILENKVYNPPGGSAVSGQIQQTQTSSLSTNNQPAQGGQGNAPSSFRQTDSVSKKQMNSLNLDTNDLIQSSPEIAETSVSDLPLNAQQKQQLQAEIDASAKIGVHDIETTRDAVQQNLDIYIQSIGAWDSTYNATYGLPDSTTPQREPTREELDVIFAINDFISSMDQFIGYLKDQGGSNTPTVTSIEYIAGLAERSGIDFSVPRSKYAVPMPHGSTLERVAMRYLGDANRWHEIAALNGLRAPYIDEEGFQIPLLVNGNRDEVTIGTKESLFIGQPVWLSSKTVRRESRRVVGIRQIDASSFILTLNRTPDLDRFQVRSSAVLEAYLPGTTNSTQVIYIPSNGIQSLDESVANIPGIDPYDPLLKVGGIDWLLTTDMDLVVAPYGDNPLATGLISLVQNALVAFKTQKGDLLQHPQWGFGLKIGTSVADLDLSGLISDLESFFNADPAISGLQSVNIQLIGSTLIINAQLGVRGANQTIPILLALDSTK
jgi:hypothetical protein